MPPIPVYIISGFLGAGKTTFIIRLLDRKPANEKWAIIINEFGKISIDGQTLQSKSAEGSLYEISGGCICCSAKGYFAENLDKIVSEKRFSRILIEPSGLGGIDHITELVNQHPDLRPMPVACLVDIQMTRHPRVRMLQIFKTQIQQADLILFSKTELLVESERDELIHQFLSDFPEKDYSILQEFEGNFISATSYNPDDREMSTSRFKFAEPFNKSKYQGNSLKISESKAIDLDLLAQLLKNEPSIVRAKGYIYTGNEWILFNYTLSGFSTEKCDQRIENELVFIFESNDIFDNQAFKYQIESLGFQPS
jgi:G3E family GTPase